MLGSVQKYLWELHLLSDALFPCPWMCFTGCLWRWVHSFCEVLIFLQNGEIFKYHKWFKLMVLQLRIRAFARVTEGCWKSLAAVLAPACTEPCWLWSQALPVPAARRRACVCICRDAELYEWQAPAACTCLTQALAEVGGISKGDFQNTLNANSWCGFPLLFQHRVS